MKSHQAPFSYAFSREIMKMRLSRGKLVAVYRVFQLVDSFVDLISGETYLLGHKTLVAEISAHALD